MDIGPLQHHGYVMSSKLISHHLRQQTDHLRYHFLLICFNLLAGKNLLK